VGLSLAVASRYESRVFEERDYVMKMVKQLAKLLAALLKLKSEQKYDEAVQSLEGACQDLLGLDFGALALVDSQSGASLLREVAHIRTFARLLEELSLVHADKGEEAKARARARHAFEMYCEALVRRGEDGEARAGIGRLQDRVDEALLSDRYRKLLR
jgi:hypothetical protein